MKLTIAQHIATNKRFCNHLDRIGDRRFEILCYHEVSAALSFNKAIDNASGDYILFLEDGTDINVEELKQIVDALSGDLIITGYINKYCDGVEERIKCNTLYSNSYDIVKMILDGTYDSSLNNKFFKLSTLRHKNIKFNETLNKYLANDFCIRLLHSNTEILYIPFFPTTTNKLETRNNDGRLVREHSMYNTKEYANYVNSLRSYLMDSKLLNILERNILRTKDEDLNQKIYRSRSYNKYIYTSLRSIWNHNVSRKTRVRYIFAYFANKFGLFK